MKTTKDARDRWMDELLKEEATGSTADETLLAMVEAAIDDAGEVPEEKAARRGPGLLWAAAAAVTVSAAGVGTFYLAQPDARDARTATEAPPAVMTPVGGLTRAQADRALASLDAELRSQEDLVEEKRKVLDTIVQAVGIPYFEGVRGSGEIGRSEEDIYKLAERNLYDLEREKQQLDTQIKTMLKLESGDLMKYAAGLNLPNNGVTALYEQSEEARRELESLRASGLGADHPDIVVKERAVESLEGDLERTVISTREILQSQVEMVESRLTKMDEVVSNRRDEAVDKALESHDYTEAKREYEQVQQRLQDMKLQHSSQRIALQIGRGQPEMNGLGDIAQNETPSAESPAPLASTAQAKAQVDFRELTVAIAQAEAEVARKAERVRRHAPPVDRENYPQTTDQPWKSPWKEALSTFSVDVDTASYTNLRRLLRDGIPVPADAVRIEECINYFDYRYAPPQKGGPFAVHVDLATCPWAGAHHLVKIGLKGKEIPRNDRPDANLVFLIDVSGSMQDSRKLPLLVESMKILVEELSPRDSVGIVVYAGSEGVVLEPTSIKGNGRTEVLSALNSLRAGGSTNGGAGIKRAYELAQRNFRKGGVNRVILATDGDFNVGVTGQGELVQLVKDRAAKGVALSVLGFGTGNINDAMLEAITNDGNGNYFYIDGIEEGRKVFLQNLSGTLVTIAKDVKLQIEFNPGKVQAYRLIGYANRILRDEDFNNDKVDAGDIGAGHTVTALYEIVPVGVPMPAVGTVDALKYQKPAGQEVVDTPEWLTVKLRYKRPDGDKSTKLEVPVRAAPKEWQRSGTDFQMAAAVALFGMKLRDSDYIDDAGWNLVRDLAKAGAAHDPHGYRKEFRELVDLAAKREAPPVREQLDGVEAPPAR